MNWLKLAPLVSPIEAVVFDFDGVWTDNSVHVSEAGVESVVCSRSDSYGLRLLRDLKMQLLILSTEINPVVSRRAEKLKIPVIQGSENKVASLSEWAINKGLSFPQIAFLGNDINDLRLLELVGLSVAVGDAFPEVHRKVSWSLRELGGRGAVREFCERFYALKKNLSPETSVWDVYTSGVANE